MGAVTLPLFVASRADSTRLKTYSDHLTVALNAKGVLDVDTVKGCTAGMNARPGTGCYGNCYAARIAAFRGIDFSVAVARKVHSGAQRRAIEHAVATAPFGFFRVGTMGDPSHAWEHTVQVIEWLAEFAAPVVITKHWHRATAKQLRRLAACGTALNTSISALDTPQELRHREAEIARFASLGGNSIARIVSCKFRSETAKGADMARVQARLFANYAGSLVDNPLRVASTHPLVREGVIEVAKVLDLGSTRGVSLSNSSTYLGHCSQCPDRCGLPTGQRKGAVSSLQTSLF